METANHITATAADPVTKAAHASTTVQVTEYIHFIRVIGEDIIIRKSSVLQVRSHRGDRILPV